MSTTGIESGNYADFAAAGVALGALILSGVTQFLAYRERTRTQRAHLWSEQLRVAREVNLAAGAMYSLIAASEANGIDTRTPEGREAILSDDEAVDAQNRLTTAAGDSLMVLPEHGIDSVTSFKNRLEDLFAQEVAYDKPVSEELWPLYLAILIRLREALGVQALSEKTVKEASR